MKYCGVATVFKGVRVYVRPTLGMPGSETALEQVMFRDLGPLLQDGFMAKMMLSSHGLTTFSLRVNSVLNWPRMLFGMGRGTGGGSSRYQTKAVAVCHHDQRARCSWHRYLEVS